MKLNDIRDNPGATRPSKRVGRGIGSGMGKTSTRGHKGQKSRSGGSIRPGFEGGQMPLYRRLPKRGFKNPFRLEYAEVNLQRLQQAIDQGKLDASTALDEEKLRLAGLFRRRRDGVRLLAKGALTAKVDITVTGASRAAVAAIEKLGGTITVTGATTAETTGTAADAPADVGEKPAGGADAATDSAANTKVKPAEDGKA
jgi:large subunit ribosomal protein L15